MSFGTSPVRVIALLSFGTEDKGMNTTSATIKIEDIRLGRRYIETAMGYEGNWTVTSITRRLMADGREVVEVRYPTGNGVTEYVGTEIVVFCDVEGVIGA